MINIHVKKDRADFRWKKGDTHVTAFLDGNQVGSYPVTDAVDALDFIRNYIDAVLGHAPESDR